MFLAQETELLRSRLLNASLLEREAMIERYPEHLPLKRQLIPIPMEVELGKRSREESEEELLSREVGKVYFRKTIKEVQKGPNHGSHQSKSAPIESSAEKSTGKVFSSKTIEDFQDGSSHGSHQSKSNPIEPSAEKTMTEFYKVRCRFVCVSV